jgi:hypothetical protein
MKTSSKLPTFKRQGTWSLRRRGGHLVPHGGLHACTAATTTCHRRRISPFGAMVARNCLLCLPFCLRCNISGTTPGCTVPMLEPFPAADRHQASQHPLHTCQPDAARPTVNSGSYRHVIWGARRCMAVWPASGPRLAVQYRQWSTFPLDDCWMTACTGPPTWLSAVKLDR